jgi:hypothetical protein
VTGQSWVLGRDAAVGKELGLGERGVVVVVLAHDKWVGVEAVLGDRQVAAGAPVFGAQRKDCSFETGDPVVPGGCIVAVIYDLDQLHWFHEHPELNSLLVEHGRDALEGGGARGAVL